MTILRYILFPVVPIYFLVTWFRNLCYDKGILKSKSYNVPIVCVGNLSVGGTGKTPMIEYIIRLIQGDYRVATLSRGYKRQTSDFVLADNNASALTIGDEPFQFYSKFNTLTVAVDSNRQRGIEILLNQELKPDVILLDDAYQHRKVKAGLNILLTTYSNLFVNDIVLPTGNLREPRSGAKRAHIIVVTKCPKLLDEDDKQRIVNRIKPLPHQQIFFSYIDYSETLHSNTASKDISYLKNRKFTLVTGIANANPLVNFLRSEGYDFDHLNYKDHHSFTDQDVTILNTKELIVTTEKDFMRLKDLAVSKEVYYLPIESQIFNSVRFNEMIKKFTSH